MPLQLHAVTLADVAQDDSVGGAPSAQPSRVTFRELAAVVSEQPLFAVLPATSESMERHRAIVDAAFKRAAVLPAPLGVIFRAPDVLTRWMELHYVSLTSALEYVEDRAVLRVHIVRADGKNDELDPDSDLASQASEAARALRRLAVAGVPLRVENQAGLELGAAFLVERNAWKEFVAAVTEQKDAHHLLHFQATGPWAPYDFVRMQFGG